MFIHLSKKETQPVSRIYPKLTANEEQKNTTVYLKIIHFTFTAIYRNFTENAFKLLLKFQSYVWGT